MMQVWQEEIEKRFSFPAIMAVLAIVAVCALTVGILIALAYSSSRSQMRVEAAVVESVMTGKAFMFVNGKPVMILSTLRADGSTVYYGVKK